MGLALDVNAPIVVGNISIPMLFVALGLGNAQTV
jgi:hypothetical protein